MDGTGQNRQKAGQAAPPKRRKSPKGEERREQILQAAMRQFADDGYQNASFAAIAQEVGLSLPGLIHYFPTKVDLLLAILERRDLESVKVLGGPDLSWRALLSALVEVVQANTHIPGVVRTFAILNAESLTRDHPAAGWFGNRVRSVSLSLSQTLQRGIESGEIRPDVDARALAAELISMMDGLQMLWLRAPDAIDMVAIFRAYVDRLIADIALG
ncbi:transcriptional regulator, TetR family [Rhizobium sp. RU35A]|uniref:TetR/AcrR family transcriptional regulator n=1 Tax=Rhizobium straminoryzae TaxID=1387186 RepID=A0A549T5E7_9HYPH|nr:MULTISPECIES: TetR/AcrR family transcriptional regulator [Rhizobium]TRL37103.1 TetR/AcrR family transcriptional regulator [Rhizobium straminoryzae]SIQ71322.1 transcriptional regulator, TetR family [Rhizobium sp. RU35A]